MFSILIKKRNFYYPNIKAPVQSLRQPKVSSVMHISLVNILLQNLVINWKLLRKNSVD